MRQPGKDSYIVILVTDFVALVVIDDAVVALVRGMDVQAIRLARQQY